MQKLKLYSKNTLIGFLVSVLFANVTFAYSIDYHLCQGELQSVAFFGNKASCGNKMDVSMNSTSSCCDAKKDLQELVIKQKSCCDNVQMIQDNLWHKPSLDLDGTAYFTVDFVLNNECLTFKIQPLFEEITKVEIPPPPTVRYWHTQEHLQVFII